MRVVQQIRSTLSDSRVRQRVYLAAAVLVTVYGGLLRFEALIVNYGWMGQPRWSEQAARLTMPVVSRVRPASKVWTKIENPYVGGDPINYLRYAREMSHFYQGHVREPMFLAITRGFLWLTENRDIAVSFASAASSTLAIFATYLLGAAAVSPGVGLAAAIALAVEFTAVARSVEGWRDDTFMLFVALTAWALLKLRRRPTLMWGVVTGVTAAGTSLTRISAMSFVIPALIWLFVETRREKRAWRSIAVAAIVAAALIAPYLINCARLYGDPFYAVNYHTIYYRAAELLPEDLSVGAYSYLSGKLRAQPIRTIDTIAQGLITFPLMNKWDGYQDWSTAIGPLLFWCAAAGLFLAVWSATGRFMLMILIMSMLPYAVTWSVGGGGDWRFTQHAYPFYLVFAFSAIAWAIRTIIMVARDESARRSVLTWRVAFRVATLVIAVAVWSLGYVMLPRAMYREALAAGEPVNIPTSARDAVVAGRFVVRSHPWRQRRREGGTVRARRRAPSDEYAHGLLADAPPRSGRDPRPGAAANGHGVSQSPRAGCSPSDAQSRARGRLPDARAEGHDSELEPARSRRLAHGARRRGRSALRDPAG